MFTACARIVSQLVSELQKAPIPFEADYQQLQFLANHLALENKEGIGRLENICHFLDPLSPDASNWRKDIISRLQRDHGSFLAEHLALRSRLTFPEGYLDSTYQASALQLSRLIVEYSTDREKGGLGPFLTTKKEDWNSLSFGIFVNPLSRKSALFDAHLVDDGSIVACSGPQCEPDKQKIVKMFLDYRCVSVLALGNSYWPYDEPRCTPDLSVERMESKDLFARSLKITYTPEPEPPYKIEGDWTNITSNPLFFKNPLYKPSTSQSLQLWQVQIADNTPLNLDMDGLHLLGRLIFEEPGRIAVHCASGIGRTGNARLIFSLLRNPSMVRMIDSLLSSELEGASSETQQRMVQQLKDTMIDHLCRIRCQRMAVQTAPQFYEALAQAILIRCLYTMEKNPTIDPTTHEENIRALKKALQIDEQRTTPLNRSTDFTTDYRVTGRMRTASHRRSRMPIGGEGSSIPS